MLANTRIIWTKKVGKNRSIIINYNNSFTWVPLYITQSNNAYCTKASVWSLNVWDKVGNQGDLHEVGAALAPVPLVLGAHGEGSVTQLPTEQVLETTQHECHTLHDPAEILHRRVLHWLSCWRNRKSLLLMFSSYKSTQIFHRRL